MLVNNFVSYANRNWREKWGQEEVFFKMAEMASYLYTNGKKSGEMLKKERIELLERCAW